MDLLVPGIVKIKQSPDQSFTWEELILFTMKDTLYKLHIPLKNYKPYALIMLAEDFETATKTWYLYENYNWFKIDFQTVQKKVLQYNFKEIYDSIIESKGLYEYSF